MLYNYLRYKFFSSKKMRHFKSIMIIQLLLSVVVMSNVAAIDVQGQNETIRISKKNVIVRDVLKDVESKSNYRFFFSDDFADIYKIVSVDLEFSDISKLLSALFHESTITYKLLDNNVVVITPVISAQQGNTITGTVTDNSGPLPGVSVSVKGTTIGSATDVEGKYSVTVPGTDATLVFSYIGYITEERTVGNLREINVNLVEDTKQIEEVVVVGYGTQKKVNLTGSVEAVSGAELAKRPVMNTTQALQGMASGVTITANSGQPGNEGETVRIRGIGTLNDNNPLVLVDGRASSLNAVNATDIESISILKDAASASIYGTRAANGVILITTKRAKTNRFSVNLSGNVGIQNFVDLPKFLGSIDYMELYDLAVSNDNRRDDGSVGGVQFGKDYIDNYRANMASDPYRYPDTDWQSVTYRTPAFQQQYNLTFSGGTDKMRALVSLNVQEQEGNLPDTYMDRYSLRVNTDYQFSEKFSASIDVLGRTSVVSSPMAQGGTSSAIGEARRTAPIYPYITRDGKPAYVTLGSNSWAQSQEKYSGYGRYWGQEGIANLKLSYAPVKSLRFEASFAPKLNFDTNKGHTKVIDYYDVDGNFVRYMPLLQTLSMSKSYTINQDLKFLVNFNHSFGQHHVSALAGFQQITDYYEYVTAHREGSTFIYDQLNAFPVGNQTGNGGTYEWALQSWFGRINYDFLGKYLIEGNVRYDGSSRFAKGYKWGLFPSFSAGWRFSSESFMENISWLSNGKIRGSWGLLGNQDGLGSNYPFSMDINLSQPVIFNRMVANGYAATDYAMRDISWEATEMTDIGLDLAFFKNKVEVVFDYYVKTTKDILLGMDIPIVMGYGNSPRQNAGKVENKGWDLTLTYNDSKGDFSYHVAATLSDVKNKVLDLNGLERNHDVLLTDRKGYPINSLWGLQADGLFPSFESARAHSVIQYGNLQGGDVKYIDQPTVDSNGDGIPDKGDGLINSDDFIVIGNTIPRYTYGLDLSAQYKGFDLGLFFQGVGKRDGYLNGDLAWAFNNAGNVQQWQKDGMWREGQTNAKYPRLFISSPNNTQVSSYWLQNASYLRLKNLQFGYTIPQKVLNGTFIQSARFYVSCHNVFTIKHMIEGYDPEQRDDNARDLLPMVKTYSLGFNLNF